MRKVLNRLQRSRTSPKFGAEVLTQLNTSSPVILESIGMASSYFLAVMLVIGQLVVASHASQDLSRSFTLSNYLGVEDFLSLYCYCVDAGGNVTTISSTVRNCVDKEFQTDTCPTGAAATNVLCKFKYYQRNRKVNPVTITPKYANVQVWTNTGPAKTYYQLSPDAIFGSIEDRYFDVASSNKSADWRILYEQYNVNVLRDNSVGNGWSFK